MDSDSKLLSGISVAYNFRTEKKNNNNKTAYGIWKCNSESIIL
jgi:hypothetical protein